MNSKFYLQISTLIIIFCLLAGLILLLFIYPTIKKIHNQAYSYATSSHQAKDLADRQHQIKRTLDQIKKIKNEKLLEETSVNSEVSLINFVKIIENITNQLHLQESINWLGENKVDKKYSILRFQIQINGGLENILKFIQEIENISTPVEIQEISITRNNKTKSNKKPDQDNQINASVTFTLPGKMLEKI